MLYSSYFSYYQSFNQSFCKGMEKKLHQSQIHNVYRFYSYALPSAVISWMPVPAASLRTSLYSNGLGTFLNTYALLFWDLTGRKVIVWGHPPLTHPPLLLQSCSGIQHHILCQGTTTWRSLTETKIKPASVYIPPPSLRSHTQAA